ncbi:hypothetical protein G6F59_016044 [Rhizopus arrhizus]|nr:hypothetical protein G6F59_016044 [Rhizopus arrhizus]
MPWSQVVARQRTSLIHHTTVVNDSHESATKTVKSKVWRVGRSPGSVLLDMTSRPESPLQLMALIAEQYPSRIAVATTKEGNRKIVEINFDPEDPSIDQIVADGIFFEKDNLYRCPCKALDTSVRLIRLLVVQSATIRFDYGPWSPQGARNRHLYGYWVRQS